MRTTLAPSSPGQRRIVATREPDYRSIFEGRSRSFVRRGAPQFVIERIATIHQTFFVGAQVHVQSLTEEAASIRYVGFRKEQRLVEYIQIGFLRKARELGGARSIVVESTISIAEGREYSELSIRWRN